MFYSRANGAKKEGGRSSRTRGTSKDPGDSFGTIRNFITAVLVSLLFTIIAILLAILITILQISNLQSEVFENATLATSIPVPAPVFKHRIAMKGEITGDEKQQKPRVTTTKIKYITNKIKYINHTSEDSEGNVHPLTAYTDGSMGINVYEPNKAVQILIEEGYNKNGFNQFLSDLLPIHRALPDVRGAPCKEPGRILQELPPASVVITFHNEAWTVLLRTVHSILDRTPPQLLQEIILVDDFSYMSHLKMQLDEYMSQYSKVKIIRAMKREGLIRGRLIGAEEAMGPVLVFLDAHCEATEGWLEPLLDRIARNHTAVVCPVIDVIGAIDMNYYSEVPVQAVGGFDWNLSFKWISISDEANSTRSNEWDPVRSATMAGGLFAIDKNFFYRIGTYDPEFEIWGAEHLELSFKTWMCGGTLEIVPCSHVGHIYRIKSPYKWIPGKDTLTRNNIRLAEVWMDEFALYYYQNIGNTPVDIGNITSRRELRENLKCKSFRWYLENVYPQQYYPGRPIAIGEVRNMANTNMCLDSLDEGVERQEPGVHRCHGAKRNQFWVYTDKGEIMQGLHCLDLNRTAIEMWECHGDQGNQMWHYNPQTKLINKVGSGLCLAMASNLRNLNMEVCQKKIPRQQWHFENFVEVTSEELIAGSFSAASQIKIKK